MDRGQMGHKVADRPAANSNKETGRPNHPASIWPPHMHKEELNNSLNVCLIELSYTVQTILMGFPHFRPNWTPDSFGWEATKR